ncbi:probable low-specificity L-threonine aldolase 2 [Limulus polyphemus]|uniref:Probable low-specificity L-threonine aldolase 2 n=1 Tax=Limulus polyphemus TaxID=6850 RepID=A0ABM1BZL2_LIMPO|nr:probable low-specificity L-threonine aldolase 2 [Limulus polyphemus]
MEGAQFIDVRSDTVTKPTPEMRKAMFEAEVGDDVFREDPTVLELERQGATLFGKESALFVPTGTMGNLVSIMAHCMGRGQEILVGDESHINIYEQGGAAQLAGVHTRTLRTYPDGTFDIEELVRKIRPTDDIHQPTTALICLENTHNRCGGAVLPVKFVKKVGQIAQEHNIPVHMDGARIMNAATKLGVPAASILEDCASVSACLSKGLGAPAGTLVAGSSEFISRVLRCRKALGGGMRQVGVLAAAGLVAINTMVNRLADDHKHAQLVAKAINDRKSENISVDKDKVQTNIILINVNPKVISPQMFAQRLKQVRFMEDVSRTRSSQKYKTHLHLTPGRIDVVKKIVY